MSAPVPGYNQFDQFPLDVNGFVRQCAWCRRIADAEGRYRVVVPMLLQGASHGCCEACAIRFLGANGAPLPRLRTQTA